MRRSPRDWSKVEEAELRRLWPAGVCLKNLEVVFDRSEASIRAKRRELGLPGRRRRFHRKQVSIYLFQDMYSELAFRASQQRTTVSHVIRSLLASKLGL